MRETEGESAGVTAEVTPSLGLIFNLLSNRHRRYALYYLHDQPDGVATTDEITDGVVAFLLDESNEDGAGTLGTEAITGSDADQRRLHIRTELQHTHLPKLEDAGVIEHDPRSETVRYWTQPSLEEWLEHARHKELS